MSTGRAKKGRRLGAALGVSGSKVPSLSGLVTRKCHGAGQVLRAPWASGRTPSADSGEPQQGNRERELGASTSAPDGCLAAGAARWRGRLRNQILETTLRGNRRAVPERLDERAHVAERRMARVDLDGCCERSLVASAAGDFDRATIVVRVTVGDDGVVGIELNVRSVAHRPARLRSRGPRSPPRAPRRTE